MLQGQTTQCCVPAQRVQRATQFCNRTKQNQAPHWFCEFDERQQDLVCMQSLDTACRAALPALSCALAAQMHLHYVAAVSSGSLSHHPGISSE
jgi:hypothetical protein